jgi:hypothetical protein
MYIEFGFILIIICGLFLIYRNIQYLIVNEGVKISKMVLENISNDDKIRCNTIIFLTNVLQNEEVKVSLAALLKKLVEESSNDPEIQKSLFTLLKKIIEESTNDKELNEMLIVFIQNILMSVLNDKINEKSIIDKLIEIITNKQITDSMELSITDVVNREKFKKEVGTSAIDAMTVGLKKKYPNSYGLLF